MRITLAAIGLIALAATASAQTVVYEHQKQVAASQHVQVLTEKGVAGGIHLSFESKTVAGAPYSGEEVKETVQTLADGNRIVRRNVTRVSRDSKGRTRRETLDADGQVTGVVISDPVAGTGYSLDPSTNTARRIGVAVYVTEKGAQPVRVTGGSTVVVTSRDGKGTLGATTGTVTGGGVTGSIVRLREFNEQSSASTKEDLGVRTFEGVEAKGSRTTTVIPAGAIGNEQPITITSEEWFSADLQVLLMTKHADPRSGETTYRLTGVLRNEPNASLFEVPAGYTVK